MNYVKDKNAKIGNKNKGLKKKIFKISIVAKCNKCQEYGHIAVDYTNTIKIVINGVFIVAPKSEGAISIEITLVIKKSTVVSPQL